MDAESHRRHRRAHITALPVMWWAHSGRSVCPCWQCPRACTFSSTCFSQQPVPDHPPPPRLCVQQGNSCHCAGPRGLPGHLSLYKEAQSALPLAGHWGCCSPEPADTQHHPPNSCWSLKRVGWQMRVELLSLSLFFLALLNFLVCKLPTIYLLPIFWFGFPSFSLDTISFIPFNLPSAS